MLYLQSSDGGGMGIALILALLILYFVPAIVGRKKQNSGAIFALNLLLGWSIIGWVVALVWSLTKEPRTA